MPTSSGDTASRLLRQAVAGDRTAVDDLLGRHRAQLKRMLAVRMDPRLRARIDPSDIVQTVLAEATQKMVCFSQPPEQFGGNR
jgi:RNA polymerase sigma-70 factor (ECF subfamily)